MAGSRSPWNATRDRPPLLNGGLTVKTDLPSPSFATSKAQRVRPRYTPKTRSTRAAFLAEIGHQDRVRCLSAYRVRALIAG